MNTRLARDSRQGVMVICNGGNMTIIICNAWLYDDGARPAAYWFIWTTEIPDYSWVSEGTCDKDHCRIIAVIDVILCSQSYMMVTDKTLPELLVIYSDNTFSGVNSQLWIGKYTKPILNAPWP